MIKLEDKTNTEPVSAEYPYGNIKDDTGTGNGTPVNTAVYADIHQFFARMADQSGITINDLPDNATNGFQLFEALLQSNILGMKTGWSDLVNLSATNTKIPTPPVLSSIDGWYKYKIVGKTLYVNGFVDVITQASGGSGTQYLFIDISSTINQLTKNSVKFVIGLKSSITVFAYDVETTDAPDVNTGFSGKCFKILIDGDPNTRCTIPFNFVTELE